MSRRNVGMPWELGWFLRQISTLKITIHTGSCKVSLSRSNNHIDFAVSACIFCQSLYLTASEFPVISTSISILMAAHGQRGHTSAHV
mmetsp:Transcript_69912/g.102438  ORF Transcript_69912/g.102438 Transcript_69912/m.102438 type:complete len:87 (-) Transcript_69912:158-418(-)